jgi:hypothetical protein
LGVLGDSGASAEGPGVAQAARTSAAIATETAARPMLNDDIDVFLGQIEGTG